MAEPTNGGANTTALKADISTAVKQIETLQDDRTSINEAIASIRSNLVTKGIPKKALDMAMTYMNMSPDKQEGFDIAYGIVREAMGLSIQSDLFENVKNDAVTPVAEEDE